ncbi:ABC transporter ATP-binding protein [Acuticoccus sp. M5D2P5]|uniref:ABC transporter ATP-binding protein n=1 Tax=Acuticoccus kalidii TaxID=2910977 RepID=UPI001F4616F2|nr:ABC transporter ATP-binding protein [Acuticoccus kalidii]MCF3933869.1 ABC transporter ATP-binding protein [Acuticoccus kalidii]
MADPLLSVAGLQSGYGEIRVLWGIDITVASGEIVCLVGSNGAGKTTLLRTISGLVKADAGAIRIAGEDIAGRGPETALASGIAHVPEGRRLFRTMSVKDNLLMGAYLRTGEDKAVAEDLDKVFAMFPRLAERRNQDAATLSGGEQQMCAIGRGIMSRPKLLMIDELSLGLAPTAVDMLSDSLKAINAGGISILLVEQDVMSALDLASRGYVLDRGRITMSGTSAELAAAPEVREAYMGVA